MTRRRRQRQRDVIDTLSPSPSPSFSPTSRGCGHPLSHPFTTTTKTMATCPLPPSPSPLSSRGRGHVLIHPFTTTTTHPFPLPSFRHPPSPPLALVSPSPSCRLRPPVSFALVCKPEGNTQCVRVRVYMRAHHMRPPVSPCALFALSTRRYTRVRAYPRVPAAVPALYPRPP